MTIKNTLKISIRGLKSNKSRSALTILGIVIGITSIMLIMSLGNGAQALILSQIQSVGSKTIVVMPGRDVNSMTGSLQSMMLTSLKERDLTELQKKNNVPNLAKVMPIVFGSDTVTYGDKKFALTILGATNLVAGMYNLEVGDGYFFTDEDTKTMNDVVVIGSKVKDELFGSDNAIGKRIRIKDKALRIVGVLAKKGSGSLVNFDEAAFVPYTTAQKYLFGINYFNRLVIEADSEQNVSQTVQDITTTLRSDHNITDPTKDDFNVQTQEGMMAMVSTITTALTLFLAAVASISLIVGGVGIMNIMLVSVSERTREIGLRKALGATDKDIMMQFLWEAILLTGAGGLIGITLGTIFSFLSAFVLKNFLADWTFIFPFSAIFLGIGVSGIVGLVFGLYPAKQAAKKSPIEALRYE